MVETVDVVVLGMGPGGEDAAGKLAEAGLSVVAIEGNLVGGECPYWGCVPSKMAIRAANSLAEGRRVDRLAGHATLAPSFAPVAARIRDEATDNWDDTVAADRFIGKGGTLVRGWARITGPGEVVVDGREFTARRALIIATGTEPAIPPIDGLAGTPFWTNRDAVAVEELPDSLLILGGGAIGLEFAQVFARFGVAATVIEAADRLLLLEEPEASALIGTVFAAEGIKTVIGTSASSVAYDGEFNLSLADGSTRSAQKLLVATGRRSNLSRLGVAALGVEPGAKTIPVDDRLRVTERTWALGDVTGKGAFTHVSMYQAGIVVRDILGQDGPPADYRALPRVTFTDPEIGAVGLTEAQARKNGVNVATGLAKVPSSARGWIHKVGNEGLIKLIADADAGVLIGGTSAGPVGGEVLSALSVAVHARVPISQLRSMIYAYPTFHRGIEDALRDLKV